jgi:hypothetical protein
LTLILSKLNKIHKVYRPWLMEVNLSPSLATDAPLDAQIKSSLVIEALNIAGVKKPVNSRGEAFKI